MEHRDVREEQEILERHEAATPARDGADAPRGLGVNRRDFVRRGMALTGGLSMASVFHNFLDRKALAQSRTTGYGPVAPVVDSNTGLPLIELPEGFQYVSFGWRNDPMRGNVPTPAAHDGMDAIPVGNDHVVLIRNHELNGVGTPFRGAIYDPTARGGTSNILFDLNGLTPVREWASLSGTVRNCAGGSTPWGTWLTCEETTVGPNQGYAKTHGWNFEVGAFGYRPPVPLWDMGRFAHEAVAVDPISGIVYETEDRGGNSGFYRFIPHVPGELRAGGVLQMAAVSGSPNIDFRGVLENGAEFPVEWVTIPNPALIGVPEDQVGSGVFNQGFSRGGAQFSRLEGCWYDDGKIYFDATNGGGPGQIWEFDISNQRLRVVFQSPGTDTLDLPDNIAISPRTSNLIICEDGSQDIQRLFSMTPSGELVLFARSNVIVPSENNPKPLITPGDYRDDEWAGACFATSSTNKQVMFVNNYTPGISFAIVGPWENGAL